MEKHEVIVPKQSIDTTQEIWVDPIQPSVPPEQVLDNSSVQDTVSYNTNTIGWLFENSYTIITYCGVAFIVCAGCYVIYKTFIRPIKATEQQQQPNPSNDNEVLETIETDVVPHDTVTDMLDVVNSTHDAETIRIMFESFFN